MPWRRGRRPSRTDLAHFVGQLRSPTRLSAVRALPDGILVVVTLKTRGVRPLFGRSRSAEHSADPEEAVRVAAAVDAALGLLPVSPSCLRRSVTLLRELHRLRVAATMHVGVRMVAGSFEAHAWVQSGGVVVNDDAEVIGSYTELAAGELETLLPLLR